MKIIGKFEKITPSKYPCRDTRGQYFDISDVILSSSQKLSPLDAEFFEKADTAYRALCAMLFNYGPMTGHPGGSISSGRIAQGLVFGSLDYDFKNPNREDADILSYAAGHKALGLYALWALRNEFIRIADPSLLAEEKYQLRFEDLLGFRKNPSTETPLFKKFNSKPLDGHPTPATPFVKIATGASGVGTGASIGLALAAADIYPVNTPKVHIIEGEGGMTPGRVHEAIAAAATARLSNVILHVDWNQSSIDSDQVCPENGKPGDYVQWTPAELLLTHDWNVIFVPNGHDFLQILTAQELATSINNGQPTAVVYRTIKGWRYGIQGRACHSAGHKFASDAFYSTFEEFNKAFGAKLPKFGGDHSAAGIEKSFWHTLSEMRKALENRKDTAETAAKKITVSRERLDMKKRTAREDSPVLANLYSGKLAPDHLPQPLKLEPGKEITMRDALADTLAHVNSVTKGALLCTAADLSGSTSVCDIVKTFPTGFYNAVSNPKSRLVAAGGICEDAMGAIMSGVSSFGRHIGLTSSYAAFIAALEHVAARMHCIGQQNYSRAQGKPYNTFIMINAHAGAKTGEDGPTHADPQALQLLQDNFPLGTVITLTPWEPQEIWPLVCAALLKHPAVLAPFVTRPADIIPNRAALGLPPASAAIKGIYPLIKADPAKPRQGTVVLQGNSVTSIFVNEVMPELKKQDVNINAFCVTSSELFQLLPEEERQEIFPSQSAGEAMGITDFTLPTLMNWVKSREGIRHTLHPFKKGYFLGSGKADNVMQEADADAKGQLKAIMEYIRARENKSACWC